MQNIWQNIRLYDVNNQYILYILALNTFFLIILVYFINLLKNIKKNTDFLIFGTIFAYYINVFCEFILVVLV